MKSRVDLMLYQHSLLPSSTLPRLHCFTLNLTNAHQLTGLNLALHWKGFCKIILLFLDCFEKDVKLSSGRALESCKEGIQCRVSLFAYFT